MQLERIAIALRPRGGWEAIDLGFRMAARWAVPVWTLWLVLFLPLLLVVWLALGDQPALAALAIWWSKPVLDRFLLHLFAHAVFGQVPRLADTLAAWRTTLGTRLWPTLLLRPFAWSRSFLAPVAQLEQQRGAAARRRSAVLGRRLGGHVLALAAICICFEWVTMVGLAGLHEMLQPGGWLGDGEEAVETPFWQPDWWNWRMTWLYAAAVTLVEPFFVAAGFSLYLSRRVMLEGWDIELGLRRLLARAATAMRSGALLALLGLGLSADLPAREDTAQPPLKTAANPPIQAAKGELDLEAPFDAQVGGCRIPDEVTSPYLPLDTEARRAVVAVLANPEFGGKREVERWRPRQSNNTSTASGPGWLAELGELLASALRTVSWLAMAVLLVVAVWFIVRRWQGREPRTDERAAPAQLFGLAIAPDSLPDDVAAAARLALQQGRLREAVSLLYRGALSFLVHQRGLRIGGGATEGDVLRLARMLLPAATASYFERLMPTWVGLAYAHRTPHVAALTTLCEEYAEHFATRPAESGQ